MFGSSILDIAIGLVFVYLLLSLIVTASSEMIASWFKRRHENLRQGLVNLLGADTAEDLLEHAMIKGLSPPALLKWANVKSAKLFFQRLWAILSVEASGPSYIPARTFAISLLDVIHFDPGSGFANDLRRILGSFPDAVADARDLKNALLASANTALAGGADAVREFQGFLLTIPDTAAFGTASRQLTSFLDANPAKFAGLRTVVSALTQNESHPTISARNLKDALLQVVGSPPACGELAALLRYIPDSASPALVKREVLRFLEKSPLADPLDAIPQALRQTDLGKSLSLLWNEAGQDLEKFKQKIETWFNDTMDRVSGWYKRKTQLVNLALAVVFTLSLNVDTIVLVNTLARNSALRESVVAQASKFVEQPPVQLQPAVEGASEPPAAAGAAALPVVTGPFAFSLSADTVVAGDALKGILRLNDTNSSDLLFLLSSSATNLASVPANVTLPRGQTLVEFPIATRSVATAARLNIAASNLVAVLRLSPNPEEKVRAARAQLDDLKLPIGWVRESNSPGGTPFTAAIVDRDHQLFLVVPSNRTMLGRTIAFHWLGWVITALAVSLGAPFWFDLLNKFVTVRSAGKAPEEKSKPPK